MSGRKWQFFRVARATLLSDLRLGGPGDQAIPSRQTNHRSRSLSDVHAALAYYDDNRDQIDADIRAGEELVEKYRAGRPSIFEKVRQRRLDASTNPISS